ncbi:MAG: transglutaminase family protein [Candidatus Methylacidiphilales bacterium]|nr:transglutaminase-like domain-containing protein [Candidatus Methylacidiphilales bacterium]
MFFRLSDCRLRRARYFPALLCALTALAAFSLPGSFGTVSSVFAQAAAAETKTSSSKVDSEAAAVKEVAADKEKAETEGLKLEREDWSMMYMQGKRSGFGRVAYYTRKTDDGIQHITRSHEEFRAMRMGITLHTVSKSQVVEDDSGTVISFTSSESGSGSNKETSGTRVGDDLVVRSNNLKKKRFPMSKEALGPRKVDSLLRSLDVKPGLKETLTTFVAQFPEKPVEMKVEVVGKETKVVKEGQSAISVWHFKTEMSFMPGFIMDMYADDKLDMQLGVMRMPGLGEMRVVSCSREEALETLQASEMMVASFIEPSRPLTDYRKMKSATYRIIAKDEGMETPTNMGWDNSGNQKVLSQKPGETVVQVNVPVIDDKAITWKIPYSANDPDMKQYLDATQYIEITPLITELGRKAVGDEKNPVLAARKIDAFVRKYISAKDFSVGFASADETARSKTGDCTEHGVLCAALARSVGLPARVITGLGYLPTNYEGTGSGKNGSFGFHMWAEAWVGPGKDDWVPMDAALGSFDIGHIAITRTALTNLNPMVDLGLPILKMMGNLKIEVVELQPK